MINEKIRKLKNNKDIFQLKIIFMINELTRNLKINLEMLKVHKVK